MFWDALTVGEQRAANWLYYGDNLDVLREHIPSRSVDLVYLDPPFNSSRSYNVIFGSQPGDGNGAAAQIQAFDDTWHWTPVTEQQYQRYTLAGELPEQVADVLQAFRLLLGENDAMAYLVNMAPRLVELHRVLKPTGSLYLHCDPTMSHYLKIMLDAVFGPDKLRSEIIWKRTSAHSSAKKWGPVHDVIFYYAKGVRAVWREPRGEYSGAYLDKYYRFDDGDGRLYWRADLCAAGTRNGSSGQPWRGFSPTPKGMHWKFATERLDELDADGRIYWPKGGSGWPQYKRYRDELRGVAIGDVWSDIDRINPRADERLGYQTQKPVALLERIIAASSNPGDVVLDPFCGCGTTVDAAQRLGRRWIGIDITFIAVDLIEKRLKDRFPGIASYETFGIPRDIAGAGALFRHSPFDFERWAVSRINARPNEKQVGDKGVDGVARFYLDRKTNGRVLVSVKGGKTVGPQFVRDLLGTVQTQKAQMGVLITMAEPTPGIMDAANHGGTYTWPVNGEVFPRVQVITVRDLLNGKMPEMPSLLMPYGQAPKAPAEAQTQLTMDDPAAASG
jgi:DNA modification methylase